MVKHIISHLCASVAHWMLPPICRRCGSIMEDIGGRRYRCRICDY